MFDNFYILQWWDFLALILIFIIGIPHGAFDVAVGTSIGIFNSYKTKLLFIFFYILLSIFVLISWYIFPAFTFITFLICSVFHFGLGDTKYKKTFNYLIDGFISGSIIIFGISLFHQNDVDKIYEILVNGNTSLIWDVIYFCSFISIVMFFYLLLNSLKLFIKLFKKSIMLLILFFFLPPLVSFSIYFCFIHTFNHVKRVYPSLLEIFDRKVILKSFIFYTLITWTIGLVVFIAFFQSFTITETLLRIIFIGLAALTFPHMFLVDFLFRPKKEI